MAQWHFVAGIAVVLAAIAGYMCTVAILREGKRKKHSAAVVYGEHTNNKGKALLHLQTAVKPLCPFAQKMLKNASLRAAVGNLTALLQLRAIVLSSAEVLAILVVFALVATVAASLVARSLVCGLAVGAGLFLAVLSYARTQRERTIEALREEVPEALRSMSVCFRTGLSLLQTLKQTAQEMDGALAAAFSAAARRMEMGATSTEALETLQSDRTIPELAFVAVALDVQHISGGSIAPVLESAQESIESELELARSLRVQTAQAKLSARIVMLMPFVLIAVFSLITEDFMAPFFNSIPGMGLLGLAIAMEIAGIMSVRRILNMQGA